MKNRILLVVLSVTSLLILAPQPSALAQGSAFTYQGRLNISSGPANGVYDFMFRLLDAPTGGVAAPVIPINLGVPVSNGLFTTAMDFGAENFNGSNRWLEISVRTNGASSFTTLSPRQALTPAPYAILAENVSSTGLTNLNAVTLGGIGSSGFWRTIGNVGTAAGANYLGTSDNQALEIKVNGTRALRIEPTSAPSLVAGYFQNSANGFAAATIAGGGTSGSPNYILGNYGFVGAGHGGQAGEFSAVVDGGYNVAPGQFSFIGSGLRITNLADFSFIGTGTNNYIGLGANNSFIGGGTLNSNLAQYAVIVGGTFNLATGGGGAFVGGGGNNMASDFNTVVTGGANNRATANAATIGGGSENLASGDHSTIGGGQANVSSGSFFGGSATVGGGTGNTGSGDYSTVGGGYYNISSEIYTTIGGGYQNTNSGVSATVGGGANNSSAANYATVPGGYGNFAGGEQSFAAGTLASANHLGSFVWSDAQGSNFTSTAANQFNVRAANGLRVSDGANGNIIIQTLNGGNSGYQALNFNGYYDAISTEQRFNTNKTRWRLVVDQRSTSDLMTIDNFNGSTVANLVAIRTNGFVGIGIATPTNKLHVLGGATFGTGSASANQNVVWIPGSASWTFTSDRNTKDHIQPVDTQSVLEKISRVPIAEWNYIGYDQRHIGPMAQDFHAQFPLNGDDKSLNDADLHGVALAAIQGLNQKTEEKVQKLEAENAELKQRLEKLEQLMADLKAKL